MPIDIGIIGASGKMGRRLIALGLQDPALRMVVGIRSQEHPESACDLKVPCTTRLDALSPVHVAIDVSNPSLLPSILDFAIKKQKPLVIGTTGHEENSLALLREASKQLPIFQTANFSLGIALLTKAIRHLAKDLPEDFSISIEEIHHVHKKDAPSGTALALAAELTQEKKITISSKREGEVIGEHSICFDSNEERLTFTHFAKSRDVLARGALLAAKFIINQPPGLYGMANLLSKDLL